MNKFCMKFICTLMMFIVLAGCGKNYDKEENALAIDPVAEKVTMPPEFAFLAIENTGGLEAWGRVRQLQLHYIVTFYNQDAGYYLTEQKCDVFPWSNSIEIAGKELRKKYQWQLSQGKFNVILGTGELENFNNQIQSDCYAQAIFEILTAPVKFIDKSYDYTRDITEINIHGKWCYPISIKQVSGSSQFETIYYQNKIDSRMDMVLLTCPDDDKSFLICGYDYKEVRDKDISIPNHIEIHLADKDGAVERQLFRIDISSVK